MYRYLFPLIICALIALVFWTIVFNTPLVINLLLRDVTAEYLGDIELAAFHCQRQRLEYPKNLDLFDVQAEIVYRSQRFSVRAEQLRIHDVVATMKERKIVKMAMKGVTLEAGPVRVTKAKANMELVLGEKQITAARGVVSAVRLNIWRYQMGDVQTQVRVDHKAASFNDIQAKAYGGTVTGQADYEFQPDFNYVIWAEFEGVEARQWAAVNPAIFAHIDARLAGSLRLVGAQAIDIFAVNVEAKDGRIARAAFDDPRIGVEAADMASIFRDGEDSLAFDSAKMFLQNSGLNKGVLVFDVANKKQQISLRGNIPVSFPEGYLAYLVGETGK